MSLKLFTAGAFAALSLAATPGLASAATTFVGPNGVTLEEGNGPATLNVDPVDEPTPVAPLSIVYGWTKTMPAVQVIVTGEEALKTSFHGNNPNDPNGIVWIMPDTGGFNYLRFELAPGYQFKSFEVDLKDVYNPDDIHPAPTFDVTLFANDGVSTIQHTFTNSNGGFYSAFGDANSSLRYVEFRTSKDINAIGQIRIDGVSAVVPEPASWALMIGGFGMAGAMLRRRKAVLA